MSHRFTRTACDCTECVACCQRYPGPLAPGDYERIREHLGGQDIDHKLWASPGAIVMDTRSGQVGRVGTITPRMKDGRCVFLDKDNRCSIHAVAPFGCAYFDTHMTKEEADPRSRWLAVETNNDRDYKRIRARLKKAPGCER